MAATAAPSRFSEGVRRTFQAFNVDLYRVLWFGTLFSFLGMQMQVIARGYLAFELTNSNTALGGVMIAFGIPQLLFGLWGGVVADRMAKRNVLIIWQSAIALSSALLAVAIALDLIAYWMLIANSVVMGIAFSFIGPARQAFIGDLVPDHLMGNAIVLQQANMNGTRVFGPALAGTLIAIPLIGMAGVYVLTTVGFIFSVITMFRLPPGEPKRRMTDRSPLQDTLDGLRYVRRDRPVGILLAMSFMVVALAFPYQGFLASVVRSVYDRGSLALGILSSLSAVGALAATLAVATLTGHRRACQIVVGTGIGFGLMLIAFAGAPNFLVALLIIPFVGAFASAFQSLSNGLTMMLTDKQYYGRVQALLGMSWSLFGILSLPLGIIADSVGIRTTLAVMGGLAILSLLGLYAVAYFRGIEDELCARCAPTRRDVFGALPAPPAAPVPTETGALPPREETPAPAFGKAGG